MIPRHYKMFKGHVEEFIYQAPLFEVHLVIPKYRCVLSQSLLSLCSLYRAALQLSSKISAHPISELAMIWFSSCPSVFVFMDN